MFPSKLSIEHLMIAGKKVLMRVDFNVPMYNGKVTNNRLLVAALDSIMYVLAKDAKCVILMSHLGRPKGIKNMKYSLAPIAEELNSLLKCAVKEPQQFAVNSQNFQLIRSVPECVNHDIRFLSDCVGADIEAVCDNPNPGTIILLENLRFHVEEEGSGVDASGNKIISSPEAITVFQQSLCRLGDLYVNDAFGSAHRVHSSMLGNGFEIRAAGLLMSKELKYLSKALHSPEKPFLAILGGIKLVNKVQLIENLLDKVSEMIIAGAMAFPFLKKLKRMYVGNSLFDMEGYKIVHKLLKKARDNRVSLHFPIDFITGSKLGAVRTETVRSGIGEEWMGLDIGPESIKSFRKIIRQAKLIVWNGPPGAYELDNFTKGTENMLEDIVKATTDGSTTILAGGDTEACAIRWNAENKVSHLSTGGAAALQLLSGKKLPGVAALTDYKHY